MIDNNSVKKTVMRNGVRVITEKIPSVRSVSIGVWVDVGSRDEVPEINGVSHLIEHMVFKGTKRRNARQIASVLEVLGGSINAFTSREQTCYHARILNNHLPIAVEVIADILNNSTFTTINLKREKQVILEEIKDVADSPSEYVHDLFAAQVWPNHSLGQPIMGNAANILSLKRSQVLKYMGEHYIGPRLLVTAAGDVSHRALLELTRKYFSWPAKTDTGRDKFPEPSGPSRKVYRNGTQQTHVCIGMTSIGYASKLRYPLQALNSVLSGGMSSRLFQSVREKAGLCYTIYSYQEFFQDTGLFCVYFGSDHKQVGQAAEMTFKELNRLKKYLLSSSELSQIKDQLKGNLMLSLEATNNRMNRLARQEIMGGKYVGLDETCANIDRIRARDIRDAANYIFNRDNLVITALGPLKKIQLDNIDDSIL